MFKFKSEIFSNIEVEYEKCADRKKREEDEHPNHRSADPQEGRHLAELSGKSCEYKPGDIVVGLGAVPGHVWLAPPISVVNLKTGILEVIIPVDKIRADFVFFEENVQYFHRCSALIIAISLIIVGLCIELSILQEVPIPVLNVDDPVLAHGLQVVFPGQDGLISVEQGARSAVKYSRADDVECEVTLGKFISWHRDLGRNIGFFVKVRIWAHQ